MTEQKFDVFLCHNSEDKPAVIQIAQQLRQNNLTPWLDVWELQPGAIWQIALEQQIECIGAAAVFVGKQGLGPWQSEEIYAFLQEFIHRKCPVIPVMLPDAPQQPNLPIFLRNRHWVDFRMQDPDPLFQLAWGITGVKPSALLNTAQAIDTQTAATVGWAPPTIPPTAPLSVPEDDLSSEKGIDFKTIREKIAAEWAPPITPPVAPPPAPQDDLSSEKGIDYRKLRDLLKAGQWREADKETYETMIRAVSKEPGEWFTKEELLNFPCADLLTIDRLWVKYSQGKYGFSVQKKIWQECGSPTVSGKNWDKFCVRVGWLDTKASRYLKYDELKADFKISPEGEFPTVGVVEYDGSCRGCGWFYHEFVGSLLLKRNL
jgi:hypothetical protein